MLSVKALTKVLEKHRLYRSALEAHALEESRWTTQKQAEKDTASNALEVVRQQLQELRLFVQESVARLRPFKIGIIDRVLGDIGTKYDGSMYRPEADALIRSLMEANERYWKLDGQRSSLEQALRGLEYAAGPRAPLPITKLRDQLKTFVFDLSQVEVSRVEACIERQQAQANLARERKRRQFEETRARAAAYANKQRQQAKSVRNGLRKQVQEMPYCPYCGESLTLDGAHADHIYPVAKGGLSTRKNMVFICAKCNGNKRQLTLRAFLQKMGYVENEVHGRLEQLQKDF